MPPPVQKEKEHDKLSLPFLWETPQRLATSGKEIRFSLNQFRKGEINDSNYRPGLADMLANKIYLYDDKMTVLCNTQDGRVNLKEVSSLKGQLAEQNRTYMNRYPPAKPVVLQKA